MQLAVTTDRSGRFSVRADHPYRLLIKLLLLAAPLIVILFFYGITDPFKVLWSYDSYYVSGQPSFVALNRDFVSTETFLRYRQVYHYDSFIFGNSRSIFYQVGDWSKHIGPRPSFHFDASGESLYGIWRKVRLLDSLGTPLGHALLILDAGTLSQVGNATAHLFVKHPLLSNQSRLGFQLIFVKTFFDRRFLHACLDFRWSKRVKPYMLSDNLLDNRPMDYDLESNELSFGQYEDLIRTNPTAYYQARANIFYARPAGPQTSPPVVGDVQRQMLNDMVAVFRRRQTDYRVVISPLYDQKHLNPADVQALQQSLGADHVYDYSGVNALTESTTNYYETSHYRPHVARFIMSQIYSLRPAAAVAASPGDTSNTLRWAQ
jgi:hypothetical protein